MPKPFLKWVGGKSQILDTVFTFFPSKMHNYHEPFLGGGSILLELLERIQKGSIQLTGTIYASDMNKWLIYTYQNIQQRLEEVIIELKKLHQEFERCNEIPATVVVNRNPQTLEEALNSGSESYYYWIRKQYNLVRSNPESEMLPSVSAMFIFLNKMGFRGVYREGPNGYNVPYGNYRSKTFYDETNLRVISALLRPVQFRAITFQEAWKDMKPDDFIYLDPPYAPEKASSFVGYTVDGFDESMHQVLFQHAHMLSNSRISFLMSNANVPLVQSAFPELTYKKYIVHCRRAIHSKNPSHMTEEVVICPKHNLNRED